MLRHDNFPCGIEARRRFAYRFQSLWSWQERALAINIRFSDEATSFECPWQNGVVGRWVESCRRELLDHIIAVNEHHVKRLGSEYVLYHKGRTYLGLRKGTPHDRNCSAASSRVMPHERLGGLHHH